jgi:hypothetical protein
MVNCGKHAMHMKPTNYYFLGPFGISKPNLSLPLLPLENLRSSLDYISQNLPPRNIWRIIALLTKLHLLSPYSLINLSLELSSLNYIFQTPPLGESILTR